MGKIYTYVVDNETYNIKIGEAIVKDETRGHYVVTYANVNDFSIFGGINIVSKEWFTERYPRYFTNLESLQFEAKLYLARQVEQLKDAFDKLDSELVKIRRNDISRW